MNFFQTFPVLEKYVIIVHILRKDLNFMANYLLAVSKQLQAIFHETPVCETKGKKTWLTVPNHLGGLPLTASIEEQSLRVLPGKTPRYYPLEELDSLCRDLTAYASGSKVLVDIVDEKGIPGKQDRFLDLNRLQDLDQKKLWSLSVDIQLMGSQPLDSLMLRGGCFRIRFWDASRDFKFVYRGHELIKESLGQAAALS